MRGEQLVHNPTQATTRAKRGLHPQDTQIHTHKQDNTRACAKKTGATVAGERPPCRQQAREAHEAGEPVTTPAGRQERQQRPFLLLLASLVHGHTQKTVAGASSTFYHVSVPFPAARTSRPGCQRPRQFPRAALPHVPPQCLTCAAFVNQCRSLHQHRRSPAVASTTSGLLHVLPRHPPQPPLPPPSRKL